MNIAGVLVMSHPDHLNSVRESLSALPGVEVHAAQPDGRLVVTVEGDDEKSLADTFRSFSGFDGIISSALVYHHFEPDFEQEL